MGIFTFIKNKFFTKEKKFMECSSIDEFKKSFVRLTKQDLALKDGRTYFKPQDTLFGEVFDNSIRIKYLKENNKEFCDSCNLVELRCDAKILYEVDEKNGMFLEQDENRLKYDRDEDED